jgi:hypothetical protein
VQAASPLWDNAALSSGVYTVDAQCAIVLKHVAEALSVVPEALRGVRAELASGVRLVDTGGDELGIVRATPVFCGRPRYNTVRFLADGAPGADPQMVFARLALVFTLRLPARGANTACPPTEHSLALIRMFREFPQREEDLAAFGQNLGFVPLSEHGAWRVVHLPVIEDTWALAPDVCNRGRWFVNQYLRSSTEEELDRNPDSDSESAAD